MRVLILGTAHPYRGGLAAYNERLARQFVREGHDTRVFTFTLQYPSFLFPGRTQYTDAPVPPDLRITRILNSLNPLSWIRTAAGIRKFKPDMMIIKYWHPFMSPCFGTVARMARWFGKNGRVKVICIFDNVIPHEKSIIDRFLTRYFTAGIDGAIVMSASVGDDLKSFRVNMPVLYSPHPLYDNYGKPEPTAEALGRLGLDSSYSYLLFFGFIRAYKGLDLLLEAFADRRLRERRLRLIVAGEFYESDEPYRAIIRKNRLEDDVIIFDRFIGEEEVASIFSAADIVVQPYRSATQSGVTQVAYHFDRPMLVTNVGGLGEIVSHGRCGYVVEPCPEAIADALHDFYANSRRDSFIAGVIEEKAKFAWEKLTGSIMQIYESIDRVNSVTAHGHDQKVKSDLKSGKNDIQE
jgi:glycosyltransferase involved in cell wall biosynthesis